MTIYATPFRGSDKETTGPSTDSGFGSLDDVVIAMGEPNGIQHSRLVIYGSGENQIVFSDFIFRVDGDVNNE